MQYKHNRCIFANKDVIECIMYKLCTETFITVNNIKLIVIGSTGSGTLHFTK